MQSFSHYLNIIKEVGFVRQILTSVVLVEGLPGVHIAELVLFENGAIGTVMGINNHIEVVLLSRHLVSSGERVVRSGTTLRIPVDSSLLGRVVDPLLTPLDSGPALKQTTDSWAVDVRPSGMQNRAMIDTPLETGVTIVDTVLPLGRGQRELVIGDRKTGKSTFVFQAMMRQLSLGTICIYGLIGKKAGETERLFQSLREHKLESQVVVVSTQASDPAGLIFVTPYTAMTIAEYFCNQGKDVLVILDDLTTHARFYRQTTLLARRFPGRNSYPGDIFYVHARLLERAGKFKKGTISCLPIAETVSAELSGYIQTNLMAITDGHLFFDLTLFNQGKRPAINPYLSVTRVGYQAQNNLVRDTASELSRFLVHYQKMQDFLHFGAELSQDIQKTLAMGARIEEVFTQGYDQVVPISLSLITLAGMWAGVEFKQTDPLFVKTVEEMINKSVTFAQLVEQVKINRTIYESKTY